MGEEATVENIQKALHKALADAGVVGKALDAEAVALTNSIIRDVLAEYVPLTPRGKALATLMDLLKCVWGGDGEGFVQVIREMDTTVLRFLHEWVSNMEIGRGLGRIISLEHMKRHGMIQDYKTHFDGNAIEVAVVPEVPVELVKIKVVVDADGGVREGK
jgi:hypothetical protein